MYEKSYRNLNFAVDKNLYFNVLFILEANIMAKLVLDVQKLPKTIFSRIPTEKVMVSEENGTIILTPFFEEKPHFNHLIGMFSDGKISIDDFLKQKQQEKELEV